MANTTQDGRQLSIATQLGKDFLLLNSLSANESLSQLFSLEIELLHEEDEVDGFETTIIAPEDILGKPVTINLTQSDGSRYFTGIINRFSQGFLQKWITYIPKHFLKAEVEERNCMKSKI